MKYMINGLAVIFLAGCCSGCSFEIVPPANKGKILGTAGYQAGVLQPGKYTLWGRDKLITLQTNTQTYRENVNVVLSDKLSLNVDVRFRGRISGSEKVIDSMFNDIIAGDDNLIVFDDVYKIYGQMVVRNVAREVIGAYSVEDVHKNYNRLSKEIGASILNRLKGTPLEVSDLTLGNIGYPDVVTKAINAAKERDLSIKKEEAQAKIDLVKKKNERALAKADYDIEITRAKTIRDSNKILGSSITPQLLDLKRLEALKLMAKNQRAVFMPVEAMTSVGAQVRMFQK